MSDLISREAVINAIANTILNGESLGYVLAEEIVSEIPSADIMECARAMKSFCWKTDCANCPIFLQCGEAGVRPCDWDLPEGEKE